MSRATVTLACAHCGAEFQRPPSRLKHGRGRNCSRACQYAARREAPDTQVTLVCEGCEVQYTRAPAHVAKSRYCSRPCRDLHWHGETVPNWQGGNGVYKRGPHWQAIKRAIRKRDGGCVICRTTSDLHVHHCIPFRMFDDAVAANDEGNLITLCAPHHRREEARWKWVKVGVSILRFPSGGALWEMARERGLIGDMAGVLA